jgi:hypothetical protein
MKTIQILALIAILAFYSCKNNKSTQELNAPTQTEIEEFSHAADKVANMLKPKEALLSFVLEGTTYNLQTKDIKTTIIPFTHYKPMNEEEGEMEETSLIWMQGKDAINKTEIIFSVSLSEKFANGNFSARDGELTIEKDGKKQYYTVKNIDLVISNFSPKKIHDELNAYSMDMSFSGTLGEFGPDNTEFVISNGKYLLKY